MRTMLKGKIHRARVTDTNVNYEGSITMDLLLMEAADILPFEMVHVLDVTNGARLATYTIAAKRGSGTICINGAAAHLINRGDIVIILAYDTVAEEEAFQARPCLVYVDHKNRIVRTGSEITTRERTSKCLSEIHDLQGGRLT